jgi:hypothetical protein
LSVTLRQKQRLRVFKNRVLRKTFGPETGGAEDHIPTSFTLYTPHRIIVEIKERVEPFPVWAFTACFRANYTPHQTLSR